MASQITLPAVLEATAELEKQLLQFWDQGVVVKIMGLLECLPLVLQADCPFSRREQTRWLALSEC